VDLLLVLCQLLHNINGKIREFELSGKVIRLQMCHQLYTSLFSPFGLLLLAELLLLYYCCHMHSQAHGEWQNGVQNSETPESFPLPPIDMHQCCDVGLEVKRKDYQNCSLGCVLCSVQQLCTMIRTRVSYLAVGFCVIV